MKTAGSTAVLIASLMAIQSCGILDGPAGPNSPPYIKDYYPEEEFLEITPPVDSIMFGFSAADPDGDDLTCSFILVDAAGEEVEILSYGNEYVFKPEVSGFYHLQGKVRDHSDFAAVYWHIAAGAVINGPPLIVRHMPELDSISTFTGSTLEFTMEVEDDHPGFLRYSYYLGSEPIRIMGESPSVECLFPENGLFDITGTVWDGEFGDTISWAVRVVGDPDTVAPAKITDLECRAGPDNGSVRLLWSASGDDGMDGRAYRTLIATSLICISDESVWDEAVKVVYLPAPGLPGTTEEMTVWGLDPDVWLYVAVRAVDDFGNISLLGECARVVVRGNDMVDGHIRDATTGSPLAGITISAWENLCVSTEDGYYMLSGAFRSGDSVMIRDEAEQGSPGEYYDMSIPVSGLDWQFSLNLTMMPHFDLVSVLAGSYNENFYIFFRNMTYTTGLLGRPTIFRNWNHFPVTLYNPPFSWEGVDIQDLARIALNSWNDLTGKELFVEVADSAAADVMIVYDIGPDDVKHHVETAGLNEDGTPAKKLICIYPDNRLSPIHIKGRMIFAHEMGHILQLGHSNDLGHLMVGGTAPITDDPSEDEINLIRSLYGMPVIFDATWYLDE